LAFCFPCRAFKGNEVNSSRTEETFSKNGFKGWYRANKSFLNHKLSKSHLNSTIALSAFLNSKQIDQSLDESRIVLNKKREEERLKHRKIIARLIDISICLAKGGMAFRGHDKSHESCQQENFKELVNLLAKYDTTLKNHLVMGPKNAQYVSNHNQNDLIFSLHNVVFKQIKSSINNCKISIIADKTSDVGHHELSIVIRHFDKQTNRPIETFVALRRMKSVDAQSIFDAITSVLLQSSKNWTSVISVCFDGASTMSGAIGGVQAKCKVENKNILYVHCYAHCLNLALVDSVCEKDNRKNNRCIFNFFGIIQFIYSFIEGSPRRHAILGKIIAASSGQKFATLKSLSTTRWACRAEAVTSVKNH